jgi:hypothetical protein
MVKFFQLRHGVALKYPDFPGVIPNTVLPKGRNPEVFPIEQLIIMEDQRVPLEKMHKKLSEHLLKVVLFAIRCYNVHYSLPIAFE